MEKQGVVAPKKVENALSKFRNNIKRNIASTNRSINTIGRKNPGTLTLVQEDETAEGGGDPLKNKSSTPSSNPASGQVSKAAKAFASEMQSTQKKNKKAKKLNVKGKKSGEADSDDDKDDGDKSCDFERHFSDEEGLNSADENKAQDSDDFGGDNDSDVIESDNNSQLSETQMKVQKTMRTVLKSHVVINAAA